MVIIFLIVVYYVIGGFLKDPLESYVLEAVDRGEVVQEVSETGSIHLAEAADLSFKSSGRVKDIYVKVGDEVQQGQAIVALDASDVQLQLQEAQSALMVALAERNNAGVSLQGAKDNLEKIKNVADENLNKAKKDVLESVDDAYLKIYNFINFFKLFKRTYFERGDGESIAISDAYALAGEEFEKLKVYFSSIKKENNENNIISILENVRKSISNLRDTSETIRIIADPVGTYQNIISSSDIASLDSQKANLNSIYSSIVSASQNMRTVLANNESSVKNAESEVLVLEDKTNQGGSSFYDAKADQISSQISILNLKLSEATIKSPGRGIVTGIIKRTGEVVQAGERIITFLPSEPFQIKADIYEQDVVNVKEGNGVLVELIAFPRQIFEGKVVSIEPAEKIIDNIVYYEATIDFSNQSEGIKSGMTADITIKTAQKEGVLRAPKNAIETINNKDIVQIAKGGKIEDRQVVLGLEGNDYVEIVSGLQEGEKIVVGKK